MGECAAHDCPLLFDNSWRPVRRGRCAIEWCGNRRKVPAHRARHQEGDR
ncbi:CGNR zinc finger domain-containing protein [Streptomyces sp. NPDC096354]